MAGLYTGDPDEPLAVTRAGIGLFPAGTGEVLGAVADQALHELPVARAYRWADDTITDLTREHRLRRGLSIDEFDPVNLSADEANKQFKLPGMKPFTAPTTEAAARSIYEAHERRLARQSVIDRREGGIATGQVAQFGTNLLVGMLDPVNVASAFIPVAPAAKVAAWLAGAGGAVGRAGVRAGVGAGSGAVGALAIEPLIYATDIREHNDWTMGNAAMNIALGAVMGGVLHTGIGAVSDWRSGPRERATTARLDALAPETREMAMRGATAAMVEGRAVNVADAVELANTIAVVQELRANPAARPSYADMTLRGDLRAPESMLQFIAAKGGILEQGGDLRAIGATEHFVPGQGRVVRREGMTLDYAREAAEEAGFLRPGSTIRDFLDAVAEEVAGRRVYRPHDVAIAAERRSVRSVGHEEEAVTRYRGEIEEIAEAYGVKATPDEVDDAVRAVMDGEHPEQALRDVLINRDPVVMAASLRNIEDAIANYHSSIDPETNAAMVHATELETTAPRFTGDTAKDIAEVDKLIARHEARLKPDAADPAVAREIERANALLADGEADAKAYEAAAGIVCRMAEKP